MGTLEFMNQDGEWEKFPSDEEIAILQEMKQVIVDHKRHTTSDEVYIVCYLCNEVFPIEQIRINGGSMAKGYLLSCSKCHAITSTGKA